MLPSSHCCSNLPFTKTSHSQMVLCKNHFIEMIEKRVRKSITKYNMLEKEDHIGLGFSGGKDSVVLIHILSSFLKKYPDSKLTAITIDEGIKGYRDKCLNLTRKITKHYQINHIILSFKDLYGVTLDQIINISQQKNFSLSACAMCGILRRRAIDHAGKGIKVSKIATAHNLDDEAQSILLNIVRGDSKKFIRLSRNPIQKHRELIPRIRPFVRISEPEIVLYAHAKLLEYHSFPCPYAYSAMRNDIRGFLSEMERKRSQTLINIVNLHDKILDLLPNTEIMTIPLDKCSKCGEISNKIPCPVCKLFDELGIEKSSLHQ